MAWESEVPRVADLGEQGRVEFLRTCEHRAIEMGDVEYIECVICVVSERWGKQRRCRCWVGGFGGISSNANLKNVTFNLNNVGKSVTRNLSSVASQGQTSDVGGKAEKVAAHAGGML